MSAAIKLKYETHVRFATQRATTKSTSLEALRCSTIAASKTGKQSMPERAVEHRRGLADGLRHPVKTLCQLGSPEIAVLVRSNE